MISRTRLAPAFLALVLGAAAGQAQPDTEDPGGEAPPDPGQASATSERGNADDSNSPFDYRASEEISEDLPVSFPVDI